MAKKIPEDDDGSSNVIASELGRLAESVKERLYERAASPFLRSFSVAWCFVNFRVLYALVVSDTYESAFLLIDQKIWFHWYDPFLMGVALPAALAFMYLMIVPLIEEQAVQIWVQGKIRVRDARAKKEQEAPLEETSIVSYEKCIQEIQRTHGNYVANLKQEYGKKIQDVSGRLESYKNRIREYAIHPNEVERAVNNLHQRGRDVIFLANELQRSSDQHISSIQISNSLKAIYGESSEQEVVETMRWLSNDCYTKDDLGEDLTDVSILLSKRGKNLAEYLKENRMTPKGIGAKDLEILLEPYKRGR